MKGKIRPIEESDGHLLRRIRAGDQDAFKAIYGRCQGPIYRFALHMSGKKSTAEDVTQEVFMALIEESCSFDSAKGTLPAYLFGVARNRLLRHAEKERHWVSLPEDELLHASSKRTNGNHHAGLTVPPIDLTQEERIGRVRVAVLSLPANYREVVVLCDLQELQYEEAAKILDCAVGTVRSRLHRARILLMHKLRDVGGQADASQANQLFREDTR